MHRTFTQTLILLIALCSPASWAGVVKAVRLWPSPEYSRITFELSHKVVYRYFSLKNPERLALDLQGVEPEGALREIAAKVSAEDPQIAAIRVAKNRPGVTRVVVLLKSEVRPQVFELKPMGEYGQRLVLDVYRATSPPVNPQVEMATAQAGKASGGNWEDAKAADARVPDPKVAKIANPVAKPDYVRLITVAIDAGHGGEDPGAKGANGSHEKDITLSIARRVKALIDKQENMRAFLTRDGDYFIPLFERVNKARRAQADLFVSIHADAFVQAHARGSSVFALSEKGATSAAAKWLAKRENEADLIGGVNIDVKDVNVKQALIDMAQTAAIVDSLKLGRSVLQEIGDINQLHKGRVEQAGFAVLKAPDIPSILVETAFISNPDEEKRLTDNAYQDKMAAAITVGIKRYFDKKPPLARNKTVQNL